MNAKSRPYTAYVLRFWRLAGAGQAVWRASLEDPHTGERRGFGSLNELVAFLRAVTEEMEASPDNPQGDGDQPQGCPLEPSRWFDIKE